MKFSTVYIHLILPILSFISCGEDFYKLFEIPRDATEQQIKKSFRNLSKIYHPDKNKGDTKAQEIFLRVNKAYETLLDPEKRKIYDVYGEEGLDQPNNLMNQNKPKGPSTTFDIYIVLEDLYNGAVKELSFQKNVVCNKCHGTGGKLGNTKQCPTCKGRGVTMQDVDSGMGFTFRMQNTCQKCQGKGITFSETCPHCKGKKIVREDKKLRIEIEKGMKDGQRIVFEKESEHQNPDTIPGDLIITLRQKPHSFFTSTNNVDLHANMPLNMKEALLGFSKTINHLDGREVKLESNKPTQPNEVQKLVGEGMPHHQFSSQKGDLFIKYNVRLPDKLSELEKIIVKQLFE